MPTHIFELRTVFWAPMAIALGVVPCLLGGCGASDTHGSNRREAPEIVYAEKPATRPSAKITKSTASIEAVAKRGDDPAPPSGATDTNSSQQPADPRAIMAVFRKGRISTIDRTASMPQLGRRALDNSVQRIGGDSALLYGTPDGCEFLAIGFSNDNALKALLESPPHMLLWRNIVLAPVSPMTSTWEQLAKTVESDGGRRIISRAMESQATLEMLRSLRAAVATFGQQDGTQLDFANMQWKQLQEAKLVAKGPRNPMAHPEVADRVEVVNTPGIKGDSANPKKVGWVWNSHDKQLYAAGYADETLAGFAQAAPGGKHFLALPDEHVRIRVQMMRAAIATIKPLPNARSFKRNDYPTLPVLLEHLRAGGHIPENPINDSAEIQQLDWNPKPPPVKGNAGWNYDPKFGRIWANTNVMRENEL